MGLAMYQAWLASLWRGSCLCLVFIIGPSALTHANPSYSLNSHQRLEDLLH